MNIRNEILEPNRYYHIYNRGINSEKIFNTEENYLFFLSKFDKYVSPVCDVLAYCLMPNHFHFLIRVKDVEDLATFVKVPSATFLKVPAETFVKVPNFDKGVLEENIDAATFVKVPNFDKGVLEKNIDAATFVKLPNFDKGQTAIPNFDKGAQGLHSFDSIVSKQIGKFISSYSQAYNKVTNRHGSLIESPFKRKRIDTDLYLKNLIVYIHLNPQNFENYRFSSYQSILSKSKTNLKRDEVIKLFDDLENFVYCHKHPMKFDFEF